MPSSQKQIHANRWLTRRTVISAGSATAVAAAAGTIALRTGWLRELYLRLAYPVPAPGVTGPIAGELTRTLRAAAETLLGDGPPADRAIRMLGARAQELGGHLELQQRFGDWLDAGARRAGAESFRAALPTTQSEILESCMRFRSNSDLRRAWYGVVFRDRVLWDRQILQPMLELYSRSDAWLAMGYDTFRGDPSGLDSYREPLSSASSVSSIVNKS